MTKYPFKSDAIKSAKVLEECQAELLFGQCKKYRVYLRGYGNMEREKRYTIISPSLDRVISYMQERSNAFAEGTSQNVSRFTSFMKRLTSNILSPIQVFITGATLLPIGNGLALITNRFNLYNYEVFNRQRNCREQRQICSCTF